MEYDFCNVDGARRLKQRIEEFWRDRGYAVDVKLVDAGFVAAMRSARTDVRSDMVNGLPSRKGEKAGKDEKAQKDYEEPGAVRPFMEVA